MFHLVSLSLQISLADLPGPCLGLCVGVACFWLVLFLVGFFLPGKFDFNLMLIPVVDRPCLALVRQCRKKKTFGIVSENMEALLARATTLCQILIGKFFGITPAERTETGTAKSMFLISNAAMSTVKAPFIRQWFCLIFKDPDLRPRLRRRKGKKQRRD